MQHSGYYCCRFNTSQFWEESNSRGFNRAVYELNGLTEHLTVQAAMSRTGHFNWTSVLCFKDRLSSAPSLTHMSTLWTLDGEPLLELSRPLWVSAGGGFRLGMLQADARLVGFTMRQTASILNAMGGMIQKRHVDWHVEHRLSV